VRKAAVKDEIMRCAQDPVYFINKYVRIRHPVRGLIPFKTFPYQDRMLEALMKKRLNVVLKARQMGYTEIVAAFVLWLILFHPHQTIMCLATKAETAKGYIKKIRTAIKKIPSWLLIADVVTDNKTSIELANGSVVKSSTKAADAGRSDALSLLVVDEAAHIKGFDEVWTGLRPTISTGGRIIMLSTPLGVGNVFEKTYSDATKRNNNFNSICTMWYEHPEHISDLEVDPNTGRHTSAWFREETKGMGAREIAQEYECAFLASGDTFFTPDLMNWVSKMLAPESNMEEGLHTFQGAGEGAVIHHVGRLLDGHRVRPLRPPCLRRRDDGAARGVQRPRQAQRGGP
jgi:hypothetical protein